MDFKQPTNRRLLGPIALALGALLAPGLALAASPASGTDQALLQELSDRIDASWVLLCAALVFLMQGGFLMVELGLVRAKNATVVAFKNIGDWCVVSIVFFLLGYGVMFGDSVAGFFGADSFGGSLTEHFGGQGNSRLGWAFVVFQIAFCGTAATIVSGAMAERTGFKAYLFFVVVMGAIIYPVFGHWVWGSMMIGESNHGWLGKLGFIDFAGASVVHGVGAWASLVGVWMVGPRLGRYASNGRANRMEANSLAYSAFGTLILWFGWLGFNGGSALAVNADVGRIIYVTNLCGCSAALVGFAHASMSPGRRNIEEKFLGSCLAGLAASTAPCNIVSPEEALLIGAVAAVLHNLAYDFILNKLRLDDVVGAVPVHGVGGVWGCLCVAFFGDLPEGVSMMHQLIVQIGGVLACFVWTVSVSFIAFSVLRATVGIRVDPMAEIRGASLSAVAEDEDGPAVPGVPGTPAGAPFGEPAPALEAEMDRLMADIRSHVRSNQRLDTF